MITSTVLDCSSFSDRDVYVIPLALDVDEGGTMRYEALLDDDERARAARFARSIDRTRYIVAHGRMREVIGNCLNVPARRVRFEANPYGKPRLREGARDIRFNLSHAGGRGLVAVAIGREVGVDIEQERPVAEMELATRFFSSAERQALAACPDRREAFFRCWTRKESFVKARGEGLSFSLDAFQVSLRPSGEQLLVCCDADPSASARWTIKPVPTARGWAAAVTAAGDDWRLKLV